MVTDAWGRTIEYVRLSLTEACNFCCPYCRPKEITPESQTNLVTPTEWLQILEAFHLLGVRAVRLTGGEPLLYPQIDELVEKIKNTHWFQDISMTTNGSLLATKAENLKRVGLNRLNISLDSLDSSEFDFRTGRTNQLGNVLQGIETALAQDFREIKINTVLMEMPSDETIKSILTFIEAHDVIWRFIEYMPFQGNQYKGPSFTEWRSKLEQLIGVPLEPIVKGTKGFGPATYYQLPNGKKLGFIFPMSHSYCDSCNRVRLTADGKLRLCLLRDDEADIVGQVRQGITSQTLAMYIASLLQLRKEEHDGEILVQPQRAMWRIGG